MPYGQDLAVMEKTRHAMTDTENPFCTRCGFRTYPRWGEHDCTQPADVNRIRHVAGDILSNLHFYRVPVEVQIAALCEAYAWTVASNTLPDRIETKMRKLFLPTLQLAMRQAGRNPNDVVQQVTKTKGRLRAKARPTRTPARAAAQPRTKGGTKTAARPAGKKRSR